jgi:hypothetical protein
MELQATKYGAGLLFVALCSVAGCDRTALSVTAPSEGAAGGSLQSSFAAEPAAVMPEFVASPGCSSHPAFIARVSVVVGGPQDVIVRSLRFGFTDRFGAGTLPDIVPIPSLQSPAPAPSLPAASAIPIPGVASLPGATAIPIPGASPINGVLVPNGTSRSLPFLLRFDCGGAGDGVLVITGDAADRNGRFSSFNVRVRVGS